jgi:hypothetical protein
MTGIRLLEGVPAKDPDGIDRSIGSSYRAYFKKTVFGQMVNL